MTPAPANSRFTAWLAADEREGLHDQAVELGSSDNYVLRSILRYFLGLPVSPWVRELAERRSYRLDVDRDSASSPSNEVPHFEHLPPGPELAKLRAGRS